MTHDHNHSHHREADTPQELHTDPASRSLAQALHQSFRVLTVLMVVVVGAFLATGFETVESNQVGLIKRFGKIVDTAEPGLAFAWPFPVGEIEVVDMSSRTLGVDEFLMSLTAEQKVMLRGGNYSEIPAGDEGLDPSRDGVLLTGDRSLYHIGLIVTWEVGEPVAFRTRLADPEKTLRDVIMEAAVRVAAQMTADGIHRDVTVGESGQTFRLRVQTIAQEDLNELQAGIRIANIADDARTWPLKARQAYEEAQDAAQMMETMISTAQGEAEEILTKAAGTAYVKLVGRSGEPLPDPSQEGPYNQIGQYNLAMERGESEAAEEILAGIGTILTSPELGGDASARIDQAEAYAAAIREKVQQRAVRFQRLLPYYRKPDTRRMLLADLMSATWKRILGNPLVEVIKLPASQGGDPHLMILPRSPVAVKKITDERTRMRQENAGGGGS